MERLSEKEWRVFPAFGENGLLRIATTNSSIDGIKLKDGTTKLVPYITRSDANNGVTRFVSDTNYEFGSDDAGCITVGLDTQTAFYQPHRFVTGQNIQVITGEKLDEDTAQFLVTTIKEQMKAKFNWGGNGATLGRMKRLEIMLPVDDKGNPDYAYMTLYSTKVRRGMLMRYKNFIAGQLSQLEYKDIPTLDEKAWVSISIDAFADVKSGRDIYAQDRTDGDVPYITAGTANNGIGYFVGNFNDSKASNAISVNRNGAVGEAFYHPYEALYGNDCRRVELRQHRDRWTQLFITLCISKQKVALSYSRKLGTARLKRLQVMLPVTDAGKPDYEYMEQYAKNMMLRKYEQYLSFLESQTTVEQKI